RQDGRAGVVLRGDQAKGGPLPMQLVGDRSGDLGVGTAKFLPARGVVVHGSFPCGPGLAHSLPRGDLAEDLARQGAGELVQLERALLVRLEPEPEWVRNVLVE